MHLLGYTEVVCVGYGVMEELSFCFWLAWGIGKQKRFQRFFSLDLLSTFSHGKIAVRVNCVCVCLEAYGAHSELNAPLGLVAAWWVPHAAPASHPPRELPAALSCSMLPALPCPSPGSRQGLLGIFHQRWKSTSLSQEVRDHGELGLACIGPGCFGLAWGEAVEADCLGSSSGLHWLHFSLSWRAFKCGDWGGILFFFYQMNASKISLLSCVPQSVGITRFAPLLKHHLPGVFPLHMPGSVLSETVNLGNWYWQTGSKNRQTKKSTTF